MPNDLTLTTHGLPTPGGPTRADRTFQWIFVGDTLTIPKYQCGQTEFCANDSEQHAWLERHDATWMHAVWHCVWEWNTPAARDDFMAGSPRQSDWACSSAAVRTAGYDLAAAARDASRPNLGQFASLQTTTLRWSDLVHLDTHLPSSTPSPPARPRPPRLGLRPPPRQRPRQPRPLRRPARDRQDPRRRDPRPRGRRRSAAVPDLAADVLRSRAAPRRL